MSDISLHIKKSKRVNTPTIGINNWVYPGGWTPSEYSVSSIYYQQRARKWNLKHNTMAFHKKQQILINISNEKICKTHETI